MFQVAADGSFLATAKNTESDPTRSVFGAETRPPSMWEVPDLARQCNSFIGSKNVPPPFGFFGFRGFTAISPNARIGVLPVCVL